MKLNILLVVKPLSIYQIWCPVTQTIDPVGGGQVVGYYNLSSR